MDSLMNGHNSAPSSLGACHPGGHPMGRPADGAAGGHPATAKPRFLPDGSPKCRLIAWEVTRSCNLACTHCRAEAHPDPYPGELSTEEAKALIDTFPEVGEPIIIFTGGDPMMRADVYELAAYARDKGLRCVMSPNGTLITPESARKIREAGFQRCSISIDGADAASHDAFRGVPGAFDASMRGIEHVLKNYPQTLSGGEKQRVALARALVLKPRLLLLDEPCSALDPFSTGRSEELITELKQDYTVVIVTHNMQQAARCSDHTAFMYLGELIEFSNTDDLFTKPAKKQTEDYITGRYG